MSFFSNGDSEQHRVHGRVSEKQRDLSGRAQDVLFEHLRCIAVELEHGRVLELEVGEILGEWQLGDGELVLDRARLLLVDLLECSRLYLILQTASFWRWPVHYRWWSGSDHFLPRNGDGVAKLCSCSIGTATVLPQIRKDHRIVGADNLRPHKRVAVEPDVASKFASQRIGDFVVQTVRRMPRAT
jgi:hypothetical protein